MTAKGEQDGAERSGGDDVEVRWVAGPDDLRGALALREEVFCGEQGVSREEEIDGLDDDAEHLVAVLPDARVVGTLRLLHDGTRAKVGRVAVERSFRKRGIASRMLALAIARARMHGCTQARLAAQVQATNVYERAGFTVESGTFEEASIPHVWMGMRL